ncbi:MULTISPECIES: hypothetical protein [Comamonas]|uniref:hypothetical protein n=1 Tax=Comamonas TaxID=283 RepID=UPI0005552893|nr:MULTISPECIES: hypothetical protein [Comamonas]TFF59290.1 hypothetical protein EIC84_15870 [Comamonas sp. A23]
MKLLKALLAVVAIALTGCATNQIMFEKPGATQEQFQRDRMTCRQMGMQSAMANGLAGNMFVEVWINDETTKCLKSIGYETRVVPK